MNIYEYNPDTGEYLSSKAARANPMEFGEFLIPARYTSQAIPENIPNGEVAVWGGSPEQWTLEKDFRGTEYWLADGSHHLIEKIGEIPPAGALYEEPPKPITRKDVSAEYNRRLALGMKVVLAEIVNADGVVIRPASPVDGYVIQTGPEDVKNIEEAARAAGAVVAGSLANDYRWHGGASDFYFKMADNSRPKIDAEEMKNIGLQYLSFKGELFFKYDALASPEGASPGYEIPPDYKNDNYWN